MKIIEITGEMYSGKDYLSKQIYSYAAERGFTIMKIAFANRLKWYLRNGMGLTKHGPVEGWEFLDGNKRLLYDLISRDYYDMYGELPDNKVNGKMIFDKIFNLRNVLIKKYENEGIYDKEMIRKILQQFGTEVIRNVFNDTYWRDFVVNAFNRVKDIIDIGIITDYRFPNETIDDAIKIRVNCDIEERSKRSGQSVDKLKELSMHASEYYIPKLKVDYEIDSPNDNYIEFIENIFMENNI